MARPRTGTIHLRDGKLFARIDYTDSAGKRRSKEKRVRTKTEGRAVIAGFIRELEDHGSESLNAIGTTFNDLADHLEKHYLIPPEYVNGRKVAGKRSYKDDLGILKILRKAFGRSDKNPDSLVFGITNNVSKSFNSVCQEAKIEDLRFHDLRRAFGTRLAKKGVPIHEIARRLGHTDIETTFTYLGLTKDSLETAANAIDEWNEEIAKMMAKAKP